MTKHVKGQCEIVDKVCKTCGTDFRNPPGLVQIRKVQKMSEIDIQNLCKKVVESHDVEVSYYKTGQSRYLGFFVGKVMKETDGQANVNLVNRFLKEILDQK